MPQATGRALPVLARALTLVALLSGLFAMHVVAGGAHSAHAASPASASSSPPHDGSTVVPHLDRAMAMGEQTFAGALARAAEDGVNVEAAALCLAVLISTGLALALPRLSHLVAPPQPVRRSSWDRTVPPARGPPRDLLAQLCVLRT
jgi:hypothetical protein